MQGASCICTATERACVRPLTIQNLTEWDRHFLSRSVCTIRQAITSPNDAIRIQLDDISCYRRPCNTQLRACIPGACNIVVGSRRQEVPASPSADIKNVVAGGIALLQQMIHLPIWWLLGQAVDVSQLLDLGKNDGYSCPWTLSQCLQRRGGRYSPRVENDVGSKILLYFPRRVGIHRRLKASWCNGRSTRNELASLPLDTRSSSSCALS